MKYTKEITDKLLADYKLGVELDLAPSDIAESIALGLDIPTRSVIAKLSSLGIYERKLYVNKRGDTPVKKEEYLERIAELLEVSVDILESLEKANKNVLILIETALKKD